jgi:hypothetical protein
MKALSLVLGLLGKSAWCGAVVVCLAVGCSRQPSARVDGGPVVTTPAGPPAPIPQRTPTEKAPPTETTAPRENIPLAEQAPPTENTPSTAKSPPTERAPRVEKAPSTENAVRIERTTPPEKAPPTGDTSPAEKALPTAEKAPPSEKAVSKDKPEPLFQGWPDPQFALFFTGMQYGYIEPCGCSGLVNQKGGLSRRHSCWKQLKDRGWDVVSIDAGNQVRRTGRQSEIKFQMTLEGLKQTGYRAIGFGPDDLRLSVGELVALTASEGNQQSPFVCANTALIDASLTPPYQLIKTARGQKIGVTAVLSDTEQAKVTSNEIVKKPAATALREVWPKLKAAQCDLYVLLVYGSAEETKRLARQSPDFDIVVMAGDPGEPTYEAERIADTRAILVAVGQKAMHVCVVGVYPNREPRLRYQRVPLDSRFADSRAMLDLLASYQEQLKSAGFDGLALKPTPHASGRRFVGSKACKDCHEEDYAIWKKTPHAHALETLVHPGERSEIARHFDPECLSCHVVGWNPQKYFPYQSGYLSREETPLLGGVGCENCHGPGSAHVDAENGDVDVTDEKLKALQVEMKLPLAEAERKCMECHDLDNSLNFHAEGAFEKYWKKVEHGSGTTQPAKKKP